MEQGRENSVIPSIKHVRIDSSVSIIIKIL